MSLVIQFKDSEMSEWEFINEIVERSDCRLLLDVNNIYVSSQNHLFEAEDYLYAMPVERIAEIHLAGYEDHETHLLDTHSRPVSDPVWDLFTKAIKHVGDVPVLIEWDNDIPPLARVMQEAAKAQQIRHDNLTLTNH